MRCSPRDWNDVTAPSFRNAVRDICSVCSDAQVIGIDATGNVASVHYDVGGRWNLIMKRKRDPVSPEVPLLRLPSRAY